MTVEIKRAPTPAEQELEASIEKLKKAIAEVPEEERQALAPLHEPLRSLGKAMEAEDSQVFVRCLVDLARTVIDIRKSAKEKSLHRSLAELPVPPYDLWLPFKAHVARPSDDPTKDRYHIPPPGNHMVMIDLPEILALLGVRQEGASRPPTTLGESEAEKL